MVLPPPPPDPQPAALAQGWIRRVGRVLALAQRQVLVLVRSPSRAGVRALVRALDERGGPLLVTLDPSDLLDAPQGATVLLEARPEHAAWLNMHRTVLTERELRLIVWASPSTADTFASEAPDFWDWISHLIEAPGGPHSFARRGLARSLAQDSPRIAWYGDDLDALREAVGVAGPSARVPAAASYAKLVEAARAPAWLVVEGLAEPAELRRLRWALAETRRELPTLLVDPSLRALPGWSIVHDRALAWAQARTGLAALDIAEPARVAALLDFEFEALARAGTLASLGEAERRELLAREDPGLALLELDPSLAEPPDALSWRRGPARLATPDPVEVLLGEQPSTERWLELNELAMNQADWTTAQHWARAAGALAGTPALREAAEARRRYALLQRPAPRVHIRARALTRESAAEASLSALVQRLRADGVHVEIERLPIPFASVPGSVDRRLAPTTDLLVLAFPPAWPHESDAQAMREAWGDERLALLVLTHDPGPPPPPSLVGLEVYGPDDYERLYARLTDQSLALETDGALARLRPIPGRTRPAFADELAAAATIRPHKLPPPVSPFVGRERELQAIAEALASGERVVLTGVAGIGKTALALEYAYRHLHEYDRVVWLRVSGRRLDQLLPELAAALDTASERGAIDATLAAQRVLLVLDDEASLDPEWTKLDAKVLLTARHPRHHPRAHVLELGRLPLNAGLSLLLRPGEPDQAQPWSREAIQRAAELHEAYEGHPETLVLASRALARGRPLEALLSEGGDGGPVDRVDLRTDALLDERLASLDPDDSDDALGIDFMLVSVSLGLTLTPRIILDHALAKLRARALSRAELDRGFERAMSLGLADGAPDYGFHTSRAVTRRLRRRASPAHVEAAIHGVAKAFGAFEDLAALPDGLAPELRAHARVVIEAMADPATLAELRVAYHFAREREFAGASREALEVCEHALARTEDDEARAGLLAKAGSLQRALGQLDAATTSYTRALEIFERVHPTRAHLDILATEQGLALVLADRRQHEAARTRFEAALANQIELRGTEADIDVALAIRQLASIVRRQGQLVEAKQLLTRSLECAVQAVGTELHSEVIGVLHDLANIERTRGEFASARRYLSRAWDLWVELHGEGPHPNTTSLLHALAEIELGAGNDERARELLERALELAPASYGTTEHPEIAGMIQSLARVHSSRGDYARARTLFERALAILSAQGLDTSLDFAFALHGLGVLHASQGEHDEAIEVLGRALSIEEVELGTREHLGYAGTELALGFTLASAGHLAQAAERMAHALSVFQDQAPNHPALEQLRAQFPQTPDP